MLKASRHPLMIPSSHSLTHSLSLSFFVSQFNSNMLYWHDKAHMLHGQEFKSIYIKKVNKYIVCILYIHKVCFFSLYIHISLSLSISLSIFACSDDCTIHVVFVALWNSTHALGIARDKTAN